MEAATPAPESERHEAPSAFEETPARRNLRVKESKVVGDVVVVAIYERRA
jgi:hypothetical protein